MLYFLSYSLRAATHLLNIKNYYVFTHFGFTDSGDVNVMIF